MNQYGQTAMFTDAVVVILGRLQNITTAPTAVQRWTEGKTMREKLIELVKDILDWVPWGQISSHTAEDVADHLIANDVTIQRWIPVTERLPDDDIPSAAYLCYWRGHVQICKYWRTQKHFEFNGRAMKVTHWMPLPEPPKED